MKHLCEKFNVSRATYYKHTKERAKKSNMKDFIILQVHHERIVNPRAGCRKVLCAIRPNIRKEGVDIGVNKFFRLMKKYDL